jgi:hypothetical protein
MYKESALGIRSLCPGRLRVGTVGSLSLTCSKPSPGLLHSRQRLSKLEEIRLLPKFFSKRPFIMDAPRSLTWGVSGIGWPRSWTGMILQNSFTHGTFSRFISGRLLCACSLKVPDTTSANILCFYFHTTLVIGRSVVSPSKTLSSFTKRTCRGVTR